MKKEFYIVGLIILIYIIGSGGCKEDSLSPGNKNNSIAFLFPKHNYVIGDTVTLKVTLQDAGAVDKVDYYVDGKLTGTAKQRTGFEYNWSPASPSIAQTYRLFARATDKIGSVVTSDTITVHYRWRELVSDKDEGWPVNLKKLFVRSSSAYIRFRMEATSNWQNPFDINNGISFGLFLDTDRNPNTGLSASVPYAYKVNDIGADYLIVAGFEDNALYKWNKSDSSWLRQGGLPLNTLAQDRSDAELAVSRISLGNPNEIDAVALLLTTSYQQPAKYDWAPDSLHKSFTVDGSFAEIGLFSKSMISGSGKRIYLLKK